MNGEVRKKKYVPLSFDLMFKKVFGNELDKGPLKYLLKTILNIETDDITILNQEILGESFYDKKTTVDLIISLKDNTKIGIEMNTNVGRKIIDRNLFYMFKIMGSNLKSGDDYDKLDKHIQVNFDCKGQHLKPISTYRMIEESNLGDILTDKIEIIRIDIPYFVDKCYNLDVNYLDEKERFIGLIGIRDQECASKIINGDENMEKIIKKVEDYSQDKEIIGAYDRELHQKELWRLARLEEIEDAREEVMREEKDKLIILGRKQGLDEGRKQGIAEGKKQGIVEGKRQGFTEGIDQGSYQSKVDIAKNMLTKNMSIELIMEITGLSKKEINSILSV